MTTIEKHLTFCGFFKDCFYLHVCVCSPHTFLPLPGIPGQLGPVVFLTMIRDSGFPDQ